MLYRTCHLMYWLQCGCDGGWVSWVLVGFAWVAPEPSEGWKLEFSSPWPHTTNDTHGEVKIYISIYVTCNHSMVVHVLPYVWVHICVCISS